MSYHITRRIVLVVLSLSAFARAAIEPPVPTDDRLTVDLVAAEPDVVTPTGITVDLQGRIWVIESNTHFPPKDYKRHATDRLLVMEDFAPDGKARKISQFTDEISNAMSLTLRPGGKVFVVCRNEIVRFDNINGQAKNRTVLVKLDTKATYPHNGLNGITFSPDGQCIYFCLGLNTGFDYSMIGSDHSKVTGGGEGGSIWRCKPDGSKVERIATGFWNCHDLNFDAFGRLFAVDNDPDDRGPCRLLDIIEGGDYGFKYKNGRKGIHPFTSWNGELPGTLPMVAPTGEAPSGILAYESDGLPADYLGQLLVTSWGDHILQRYTLKEKGASFESRPQTFLRGGEDFRPVGIAQAPDGSVVISDWVDKSYTLHGKGRVWRIRAKTPPKDDGVRADQLAGKRVEELAKLLGHSRREVREAAGAALVAAGASGMNTLANALGSMTDDRALSEVILATPVISKANERILRPVLDKGSVTIRSQLLRRMAEEKLIDQIELTADSAQHQSAVLRRSAIQSFRYPTGSVGTQMVIRAIDDPDPFIRSASITTASRKNFTGGATFIVSQYMRVPVDPPLSSVGRAGIVVALRRGAGDLVESEPTSYLRDADPIVRRVALQWVGEERLSQCSERVLDALTAGPVTRDLLEAYLACQEKLTTQPPEPGKPPAERSGRQLAAEFLADGKQDLAFRKLAITLIDPADPKLPAKVLISLIDSVGLDAVKALAWRADAESQKALREIAADDKMPADWRREAAQGLALSARTDAASASVLRDVLHRAHGPALHLEGMRSLRGLLTNEDAKQILPSLRAGLKKQPAIGTPEERRDWAEQILLAFRSTPDMLTDDERKELQSLAGARPKNELEWMSELSKGGDPEAGRQVFTISTGARCTVCHQIDNRGGDVGPDLSVIARSQDRKKIIESILYPSREIAPMYEPIVLELKNGDTITGVGLNEGGATHVVLADATGTRHRIKSEDIAKRRTDKISVMPESLLESMTVKEVRDLVAYLASRK